MNNKIATPKNLAQFIKIKRTSMGISCRELSRRAGYANSSMTRIEKGKYSPSFKCVRDVFEELKTSFTEYEIYITDTDQKNN